MHQILVLMAHPPVVRGQLYSRRPARVVVPGRDAGASGESMARMWQLGRHARASLAQFKAHFGDYVGLSRAYARLCNAYSGTRG